MALAGPSHGEGRPNLQPEPISTAPHRYPFSHSSNFEPCLPTHPARKTGTYHNSRSPSFGHRKSSFEISRGHLLTAQIMSLACLRILRQVAGYRHASTTQPRCACGLYLVRGLCLSVASLLSVALCVCGIVVCGICLCGTISVALKAGSLWHRKLCLYGLCVSVALRAVFLWVLCLGGLRACVALWAMFLWVLCLCGTGSCVSFVSVLLWAVLLSVWAMRVSVKAYPQRPSARHCRTRLPPQSL